MKAWITYGFNDMRLEEVPDPAAPPGWVVVRVETCQPSVTDVLRLRGVETMGHSKLKKMFEKGPVQVLGHECCGVIVEVGEGVTHLKTGDRVASMGEAPCGICECCHEGRGESCTSPGRIGTDTPGWFAEYASAPVTGLTKIPNDMDSSEAACLQPFSAAVSAVDTANILVGATVVCLGQGVMGLYCLQLARVRGATRLIGIDVAPECLELSRKSGADHAISSGIDDPVEAVLELTQGKGADIVFECAGGNPKEGLAGLETLKQAMQIAGRCGTIVQVAHPLFSERFDFDIAAFKRKSLNYVAPRPVTRRHFSHGIELVARGRVQLSPLITHVLNGIEKVPEAFEITGNKRKYKATNPAQVVITR